jgi:hypothetical protein
MIHFNHLECVGGECVRKGEGELCEGGGVGGVLGDGDFLCAGLDLSSSQINKKQTKKSSGKNLIVLHPKHPFDENYREERTDHSSGEKKKQENH